MGLGTAAVVKVASSILAQLDEGLNQASRMAISNNGRVVGFGAGSTLGFPSVVFVLAIPIIVLAGRPRADQPRRQCDSQRAARRLPRSRRALRFLVSFGSRHEIDDRVHAELARPAHHVSTRSVGIKIVVA